MTFKDSYGLLDSIHILYVEDDPIIMRLTTKFLEMAGAIVICADNCEDTIFQLAVFHPDLLLIDLRMPKMNGSELLIKIRQTFPKYSFPIFALTSSIPSQKSQRDEYAGVDAFFRKPVNVQALAAAYNDFKQNNKRSRVTLEEKGGDNISPMLDLNGFRNIMNAVDRTSALHLIDEFEASIQTDIAIFLKYILKKGAESVREAAHRCYGLCLIFGASSLAMEFQEIEDCIDENKFTDLDYHITTAAEISHFTVKEMRERLEEM